MPAVIYARYSSENQRKASIKVCRCYAERQGWTVTDTYGDRAVSGVSMLARPESQRLLADAEARKFDVIVCEAINRLGRRLADVADVYDRVSFRGVQLHATALGPSRAKIHPEAMRPLH